MSRPKIISLGEVLWDLFPDGARFGGAPANFACHAAILGGGVTMVSAVGDDERGREAIEILGGFGIHTSLIQVVPGVSTGTVGVELDEVGRPAFTIHGGSAWDRMTWTPGLGEKVLEADAVYFGTLGQRSEVSCATIRRALEAARNAGIPRILDVNLRPPFFDGAMIRESIDLASVLKLSDDELATVAGACEIEGSGNHEQISRDLLEQQGLDHVIMTRGAEGAMLASPDEVVTQPGFPVEVRDTVGAGDSFTAVFTLGLLRGEPRAAVLQRACERAAEVCTHSGAVPTVPV